MNYTDHYKLQKPLSNEKYNVAVANSNADSVDELLHQLELKNQAQDNVLATKTDLTLHSQDKNNPHETNKAQIGLSNVTNDRQIRGLSTNTREGNLPVFGIDGYTVKDSGFPAQEASLEQAGFVQLTDSVSSDSTTTAATPNSVKQTYTLMTEHTGTPHAPADAERNVIACVLQNGTAIAADENRAVNIIVPTKISELQNDTGFIPGEQDHDTTYTFHADTADETVALKLTAGGTGTGTQSISIKGTEGSTVTQDTDGSVLIHSADYVYSAALSGTNLLLLSKNNATLSSIDLSALTGSSAGIFYSNEEPVHFVANMTWIGTE